MKKALILALSAIIFFSPVANASTFFHDLGEHAWARTEIESLAGRGVINGTGWGEFSPAQKVRRADFVVMLIRALGITQAPADSTPRAFNDVHSSAYYHEAVHLAAAHQIITGDYWGNFHPLEFITRQDMFVMLDRVLRATDDGTDYLTASGTPAIFNDAHLIASYAQEAINLMHANGLIAGVYGGINPLHNATRAETAILIFRINVFIGDFRLPTWGTPPVLTPAPTLPPATPTPVPTPTPIRLPITLDPLHPYLHDFTFGTFENEYFDNHRRTRTIAHARNSLENIIGANNAFVNQLVHSRSPLRDQQLDILRQLQGAHHTLNIRVTNVNILRDVVPIHGNPEANLGGGIVEVTYQLRQGTTVLATETERWLILDDLSWGEMRLYGHWLLTLL